MNNMQRGSTECDTPSPPRPLTHRHTLILRLRTIRRAAGNSLDLSTVAVVGKEVGGAAGHACDDTGGSQSLDAGGDRGGSGQALESLEVENQTGDVGGGH